MAVDIKDVFNIVFLIDSRQSQPKSPRHERDIKIMVKIIVKII